MVLAHDINNGLRTKDVRVSEDILFNSMLLSKNTMKGLEKSGYYKPSPIQLHGIPLGKCGFDLLLEAKSGTGKTAVFSVIALEKLNLSKGIQTIIMAPTREIVYQVHDVIKQLGVSYTDLCVEAVIGGMPVQDDIARLKQKVHIIVGSPGRLKHLIQDGHIDTSSVRLLVLDEADKLVEKSFLADIDYIFSHLPKQKQVIMSSATYPEQSKEFIYKYVQNAQHVCPDSNCILLGIEQKVTIVPCNTNIVRQTQNRYEEIKKIMSQTQFKQCLIFCNYQARVIEVYKMLIRDKWPAEQLYGQQEQTKRLDALKTLQEYKCRILVSTDLAARGIDASNVDLVINFEPPFDWQTYLHRIGRAGRYGSFGVAISILSKGEEVNKFKESLGQINLPLNMKKLWTDEPFDLQSSDFTPEENSSPNKLKLMLNQNNHTHEELWNALSDTANNKELNDILTFESLCDSFKSGEATEIQTFSDLLISFKNNDNQIENDVNFKHVKTNKLSIPFKIFSHNIINDVDELKNNIDSINNNKIKNILPNKSCVKEYEQNDNNTDNYKENMNSTVPITCKFIEQNLIDAGLPTAFGSSKHNKTRYKTKITAQNIKKHNRYEKSSYNENIKEGEYYNRTEHNEIPNVSSECISTPGNRIKSKKYYQYNTKQNRKESVNTDFEHYEEHHNTHTETVRLREFNAWYNKLKAQCNWIQQIAYLEEMTQFNH